MTEITVDQIEEKNKRKGFYTSLFLHLALLILALLPLLTFPTPPPGQEGILVNLGMPDVGQGEENAPPAKAVEPIKSEPTPPPPPEPEPEVEPEPEPTPPEPEPIPEPVVDPTPPKEVITDDNSKEIALQKERERKKREEDRERRLEDEKKKREQREADRKKQAEAEADAKRKKAQEEARKKAEAKAKADAERRAAEAAAKAKAEREAAAKAEADELGSLFGGGSGSGKGKTGSSGNQGDPNGDPNSSNLEGVSAGAGSSVGGGLRGRGILNAPKVNDDYNRPGIIVIKVCVDGNGRVTSATYTQKGSNSANSTLKRIAIKNAKAYKFSKGTVDKQCGEITYNFKVK